MSSGYFPTYNYGRYEDCLKDYTKEIFQQGVVCGCTGKTYNTRPGFWAHTKTQKHQKWVDNLTSDANKVRIPQKQDTYNSSHKCIICMDPLNEQSFALPCAHTFHTDCINDWLKIKKECPVCKTKI
tara:strand:+ start:851 stop:1228 length:378 start_codon:yes stop_codon:yes gene_type:complete